MIYSSVEKFDNPSIIQFSTSRPVMEREGGPHATGGAIWERHHRSNPLMTTGPSWFWRITSRWRRSGWAGELPRSSSKAGEKPLRILLEVLEVAAGEPPHPPPVYSPDDTSTNIQATTNMSHSRQRNNEMLNNGCMPAQRGSCNKVQRSAFPLSYPLVT